MKLTILTTCLLLTLTSAFAASPVLTGSDAIDLVEKLQKTKVLSFDGHAMGKTYYRVNESALCLFEADTENLSCNNQIIADEDTAAETLEAMINTSVVVYDGAAMGGKAYFKANSEFCFISNDEKVTFSCN